MSKKRLRWFVVIRLLGIVLFIIVLSRTDLKELWGWMKVVDSTYLMIAILFQLSVLLIKAWRWYILNEEGFNAQKLIRRSGEFFEGYAIGVVTPGRIGELMKAGHAVTRKGILSAGLKVIAERGTDLSIFIIIAGIGIIHNVLPGISAIWGWLVMVTGLTGGIICFLILVSPAMVRIAEKLLKLMRLLQSDQNLDFTNRPGKNALVFLFLSLTGNLSYFICCYFLASGVAMGLSLVNIAGGVATAGVMNTLPVTIMGLGTREVTLLYVFRDLPQAQVMAFSGLVFLVGQVGGGLLSMLLGQIFLLKTRKM